MQVGSLQGGVGGCRISQRGTTEIGLRQVRVGPVCAAEVGLLQIGVPQSGLVQVRTSEVVGSKIDMGQILLGKTR